MKNIILFASGEGTNFSAMIRGGVRIHSVITDNRSAGVIERAKNKGVTCICIPKRTEESREEHENRIIEVLPERVDLIILAGYMRMLTPSFLESYPKIINIHPSLLPSFKGKTPIEDAYRFGCKYIGATVHWVNEEMDAGKIIEQEGFRVDEDVTLTEVIKKMHLLENAMYPRIIHQLITQKQMGGLDILMDMGLGGEHQIWKRSHNGG